MPPDITFDLSKISNTTSEKKIFSEAKCLLAISLLVEKVLTPVGTSLRGKLAEFKPKVIHFTITRGHDNCICTKLQIVLADETEMTGQWNKSADLIIEETEKKMPDWYMEHAMDACLYCALKSKTRKEELPA